MKTIPPSNQGVNPEFDFDVDIFNEIGSELFERQITSLTKHKRDTMVLSHTYVRTGLLWRIEASKMLRYCGNKIAYVKHPDTGIWQIASAMFCKRRLCPLCSWRRSVRIFREVYQIISTEAFKDVEYLFLTLTIRNCKGDRLSGAIDRLIAAWRVLTHDKDSLFYKAFLGTMRSLEVTYNDSSDTYHPHLHALVAVDRDYFKRFNRHYISHDKLKVAWRDALNHAVKRVSDVELIDNTTFGGALKLGPTTKKVNPQKVFFEPEINYYPQCRIEKVYESTNKAIAEVAKYTVKPSEYLDNPRVVEVLDVALRRKRLLAYGGIFVSERKRLNLEDELSSETVEKVSVSELLSNPLIAKLFLSWTFGGSYRIVTSRPYEPGDDLASDTDSIAGYYSAISALDDE
jgi:plasmid rolling circle replication initiator protein Rep